MTKMKSYMYDADIEPDTLEKCLNRYAIQTGFEIRTVRSEKEGGIWSRKTYKCHHGGKYEPKKKDPTHNRSQESAL